MYKDWRAMLPAAELGEWAEASSLEVAWALALRLQKSENTCSVDFKLCFLVLRWEIEEQDRCFWCGVKDDRSSSFKAGSLVPKPQFVYLVQIFGSSLFQSYMYKILEAFSNFSGLFCMPQDIHNN